MMRRSARVTVVLVFVAIAAAAAHQAVTRSQAIEAASERLREIGAAAAQGNVALAEIAAAERGYVAPGQGLDFWAGRVDEALASARAALAALQSGATQEGIAAAESAVSRLHDFAVMDRRARDYTREGQRGMASDLIFADGYEMVAAAREDLASAVSIEGAAVSGPLTRHRQVHLASLGALAACATLASLLLLRMPRRDEPVVTAFEPTTAVETPPADVATIADNSIGAALDASLEGLDDFVPASPALPASPASSASPVDLSSAADVCVDLARLLDARDLQAVLARIAAVLGAEGLIVWLADGTGHSLAPALTHGYAPSLLARLGSLSVEEDNATAAAWRAKTLRVVDGALAVPLLTSDGCSGVLAVELKDGKERAGDVQSLTRIMAAQLAASVSTSGSESSGRAAEG